MKESRYNVWIERDGCHYVYNGLSGALLQMSGTERTGVRQFTQGATECDCSPDLLRKMVEARMLIRDVFDELDYLSTSP
jgi:hypothetical protein